MADIYENLKRSIDHIDILHNTFYSPDHPIYQETYKKFEGILNNYDKLFLKQIYGSSGRQMILADIIEYVFNGRGYYFVTGSKKEYKKRLSEYIRLNLYFTNLLMCYESMTVNSTDRNKFLDLIKPVLPPEEDLNLFEALREYNGKIGLPEKDIPLDFFTGDLIDKYDLKNAENAKKDLNKYFDTLLPKTAGGLWHEMLVYIFLIRYRFGYVIPLLLNQRFLHGEGKHIVPPDFLLLTNDKKIYGIEVGMKKEIQSGSFSLESGIPTATIDTVNSRSSDRCPLCGKWILFCDRAIDVFSDLESEIDGPLIKCLDGKCKYYSMDEIAEGKCPFTKYSRNKAPTLKHTNHLFSDSLHYHYKCVLDNVDEDTKKKIIDSKDTVALKTHLPYYKGLESLLPKR